MLSSPFRRRHKWCCQRWSGWLYKGAQSVDATETDRWCYWSTECTAETRTFAYDWLLSSFWQNINIRLKKKGFGPDFVKWVSILMADAKSCVAYCGWLYEHFAVEAGIRQGCPFSPLAFILAVELLATKIRHCENIKGLNYWKARNGLLESIIKIALYADDLTLF